MTLIFLGFIFGILSLLGMLIGSSFSGKFHFNFAELKIEQVIFALVPGIWEEIFYRGLFMIILLKWVKNFKKAFIIQSIVFGLVHLGGDFSLWGIIDIFSIIIMGLSFTFVVYKTDSLIPAMIMHFLHDAMIFLVQVPEGVILTDLEHMLFFLVLWLFQGIIAIIAHIYQKYFSKVTLTLYSLEKILE